VSQRKKKLVMKQQPKCKCSRKVRQAIRKFLSTHTHAAWQHLQEVIQ